MNEHLPVKREWAALPLDVPAVRSATEYTGEPQPGSILDYWRIICGRKLTLAVIAIAGLLVAVLVTIGQPRLYRARTSLEIQDVNQEFMNMKLVSPVAESSSLSALSDMETQIKILQSDTLVGRALADLKVLPPATSDIRTAQPRMWRSILTLARPAQDRDGMIEEITKNLKVAAAGQTRIIEITFHAPDPSFAARFANALASDFIEQNMQARWETNRHTSEWLGQQLDGLRVKLQQSEDALQLYARRSRLIYTGDKQNVSEEKLRQLQTELLKAQADRVARQSRFEISRTSTPDTLPDVRNDSNLRSLETTLTDLRRREAELSSTFKPDYSKIKKTRAEIASLEAAIDRERAAIVSRINNDFQEAQHRERLLDAAYASQVSVVSQDSAKSIQYSILKREVDTNRQIYEAMLQRVKELSIRSAMRSSNVRVIDPARPPARPYKPNLALNAMIGLLCGAALGMAVIVTRARTDRSLHEPGDAGNLLGLPELGVIPTAADGQQVTPSVLSLFPKTPESVAVAGLELVPQAQSSLFSDSFRSVLASIIFSAGEKRPRVLVVTSAAPHEGKTTAATNLAVALAQIEGKVLLIDGDIRNPHIHDIFKLENSKGVTNLLETGVAAEDLFDSLVQTTTLANLCVLASGPGLRAATDLLFSASMSRLVSHYRRRFDMVIIDTPPMLSMPDARVWGRASDGVVLIARAGQTTRTAILTAFRRLIQDQTTVLGIILNDWKAKSSPYYGYYGPYNGSGPKRYADSAHRDT